jgi:hypothetical protein
VKRRLLEGAPPNVRKLAAGAAALVGLGLVVWIASSSCNRKVTHAECTEMLDHYLDMAIGADPELAKLPPAQQGPVREMKKALKKGEKSYAQVEQQCDAELTRKEYACAVKAPSPNDWEACIE